VAQLNRGRVSVPAQAALSGSHRKASGSAGGYLLTNDALQRVLGLKSYKTACTLLHKLRRAMVRPGRDRLSGRVEGDEAFVGGEEEGIHGRQTKTKAMIAVAAEEDGPGIGRIRMRRILNASADSLVPLIEDCVEPGSVVHTDGWRGYPIAL